MVRTVFAAAGEVAVGATGAVVPDGGACVVTVVAVGAVAHAESIIVTTIIVVNRIYLRCISFSSKCTFGFNFYTQSNSPKFKSTMF